MTASETAWEAFIITKAVYIAVAEWIAFDMGPIGILNDKGFKLIIKTFLLLYHSIAPNIVKRILYGKEEEPNGLFNLEICFALAVTELVMSGPMSRAPSICPSQDTTSQSIGSERLFCLPTNASNASFSIIIGKVITFNGIEIWHSPQNCDCLSWKYSKRNLKCNPCTAENSITTDILAEIHKRIPLMLVLY